MADTSLNNTDRSTSEDLLSSNEMIAFSPWDGSANLSKDGVMQNECSYRENFENKNHSV